MLLSRLVRHLSLLVLAVCLTACSDGTDTFSPPDVRPVIFVHGQSGSAQQFETQAMRFTSSGYPQNMLFAFEYDTSLPDNPLADLDIFIDSVLAQTGATNVYAIGHSRGTSVWTSYLEDPSFGGPAKVAKYVNIDGRDPTTLPGGVPTIGIWGEWNSAGSGYNRRDDTDAQIGPNPEDNFYFPDKSHTEVATSAEAFRLMYSFLTGAAPFTTSVTPKDGTVQVSGRAVFFPENTGYEGATLQVWEVDAGSGQRIGDSPVNTLTVPASGNFGPLPLTAGMHYEFTLLREATASFPAESEHHFYAEPFLHDNFFFRLQSSRPGESIEAFIPRFDDSAGMVVLRQKEFWGDQGTAGDELFIDGLNVLTPVIAPRELGNGSGVNLALFLFDDEGDNITDLDKGELFPFNLVTFLTGADVFIPASAGGSASTEVSLVDRGTTTTTLYVPSWPSDTNRVSVMFRDDR